MEDRRLGDEWIDWSGNLNDYEWDIKERKRLFFGFSIVVFSLLITGSLFLGYLIKPRLNQITPLLSKIIFLFFFFILSLIFLWFFLLAISTITGKNYLPFPRLNYAILDFFLIRAIWLGEKLGISKDRMCNSFIKVNNALVKSIKGIYYRDKLLILLPRCLDKRVIDVIKDICKRYKCEIMIVGGGNLARKIILEKKPTAIIGVACERDLVSGIKDVAKNIPVIGIANKRPKGPCKDTYIDINQLEEAIKFFSYG